VKRGRNGIDQHSLGVHNLSSILHGFWEHILNLVNRHFRCVGIKWEVGAVDYRLTRATKGVLSRKIMKFTPVQVGRLLTLSYYASRGGFQRSRPNHISLWLRLSDMTDLDLGVILNL
jgi:hypothetical protein